MVSRTSQSLSSQVGEAKSGPLPVEKSQGEVMLMRSPKGTVRMSRGVHAELGGLGFGLVVIVRDVDIEVFELVADVVLHPLLQVFFIWGGGGIGSVWLLGGRASQGRLVGLDGGIDGPLWVNLDAVLLELLVDLLADLLSELLGVLLFGLLLDLDFGLIFLLSLVLGAGGGGCLRRGGVRPSKFPMRVGRRRILN